MAGLHSWLSVANSWKLNEIEWLTGCWLIARSIAVTR